MNSFAWWSWGADAVSDIQKDTARLVWAATETNTRLSRLEQLMAADRDLLASLAADLTALAGPVADLFDSYAAAQARIVELEGDAAADEAGDLSAIAPVKAAFDAIAAKFTSEPEVPDVEPVPAPGPADGDVPA